MRLNINHEGLNNLKIHFERDERPYIFADDFRMLYLPSIYNLQELINCVALAISITLQRDYTLVDEATEGTEDYH